MLPHAAVVDFGAWSFGVDAWSLGLGAWFAAVVCTMARKRALMQRINQLRQTQREETPKRLLFTLAGKQARANLRHERVVARVQRQQYC